MTFKIDDGIPAPVGNARTRYPMRQLEVGQSFFVPGKKTYDLSGLIARHKPKKFTSQATTENGVKGVRVWRLA